MRFGGSFCTSPFKLALKRLIRSVIVLVPILSLLGSGCVGLMPSPFRPSPGPQQGPKINDLAEAFDSVARNYRMGPDDVLLATFETEWNVKPGSYKLDTMDQIQVKFLLDAKLNEETTIRPDGMITLQGIGDVLAVGLSPDELARRIQQKYIDANIFSQDELADIAGDYRLVTVHVVKFYEKVNRVVQSLRSGRGDTAVQFTVNPDGTIDFPLLRERVIAAGYTVPQVERSVNRLYRSKKLKHVIVSLQLGSAKSRKVYVLGQVNAPGAYEIRQPVTALHALAMAGGHQADTADLTSVILISKDIHGKPIGRRLDLKRILDVGDLSSAILVKPYDVIFVPKTYIRDVRLFMEQYFATVKDFTSFVQSLLPAGG